MPLASREKLDDNLERNVITGEAANILKKWQLGQGELANSWYKTTQQTLLKTLKKYTPMGTHLVCAPNRYFDNNPCEDSIYDECILQMKICKNTTGLKVHQTKMGCIRKLMLQHTVNVLDNVLDTYMIKWKKSQGKFWLK